MAYAFEESYTLSSISKAARHLLSELDKLESEEMICYKDQYGSVKSKDQLGNLRSLEQSGNATINVQYPAPPVLFICQGLAGVVVKKVFPAYFSDYIAVKIDSRSLGSGKVEIGNQF